MFETEVDVEQFLDLAAVRSADTEDLVEAPPHGIVEDVGVVGSCDKQ